MAKDRSFWASRETVDGYAWANYHEHERSSGGCPNYPTMSDATRAEVTKKARKGQADLVQELQGLIAECYMLHGRLTNVFADIKDSASLSGMEALTLYAIVNSDKPVTVPQIGRALGHARQVIQRAARELELRGLVETRDNPGHKRAALLVPTAAGAELKRNFDAAGQDVARTLVDGLDLKTIRAAHAGLHKLRTNAEARDRELHGPAAAKPK
ncbi:MAG: helix-turn-helix domain-containing protein [Novosphingobium sp.]